MDHVCLALPLLPDRTADARSFLQQLDGARREEFDRSERRIGITREIWYLARLPAGDTIGTSSASCATRGALRLLPW